MWRLHARLLPPEHLSRLQCVFFTVCAFIHCHVGAIFAHALLGAARPMLRGSRFSPGMRRALFILRAGICAWRSTLHGQTT